MQVQLSQKRHAAAQPSGTEAPCMLAPLSLSLSNLTNICYTNASILIQSLGLYYRREEREEDHNCLGKLRRPCRSSYMDPENNIPTTCTGKHQQEDAAEFITYLQEVCRIPSLQGMWSARRTANCKCATLDQSSLGITMSIPYASSLQLQDIIDKWSNQHMKHALAHPPQIILLRMDRFRHTEAGVVKDSSCSLAYSH